MKSFNPEGLAFHRSEERLPEAQEALYDAIVPENKGRAIDVQEFSDLYGTEGVEKDKAYIATLEKKFQEGGQESSRKFGELFEALVNYQIENSDLMGGNASVITPARFDDVVNGIDSIVEFEDEGVTSHLALAIDVTKSKKELSKKFEAIKDSIDRGNLSKIKYFKSKSFRGELRGVPRVIVGADQNTVENISETLLRFMRMKKEITANRKAGTQSAMTENLSKEFSRIRQELASHPLQAIVLTEIKEQLEAFKEYAEANGKSHTAEDYAKILYVIDEIVKAKEEKASEKKEQKPNLSGDQVYTMIMEHAKSFRKQ